MTNKQVTEEVHTLSYFSFFIFYNWRFWIVRPDTFKQDSYTTKAVKTNVTNLRFWTDRHFECEAAWSGDEFRSCKV